MILSENDIRCPIMRDYFLNKKLNDKDSNETDSILDIMNKEKGIFPDITPPTMME